jgi:NADPH-dependent 2,4-dienoyl-CoA reductase/sulfur reductase-like enzyme
VVVVGGGAAGLATLSTLREEGFAGSLAMVGEEPGLPYDRPPLSKQGLTGPGDGNHALISADAMDALQCDVYRGEAAIRLDARSRSVVTSRGRELPYDVLVVATGVRPRIPPWAAGHQGLHVLRTAQHAARLSAALQGAAHLLVIGGGFLGTEVAASARRLGVAATLVDIHAVPMLAQVGPLVAQRIAELHAGHGVALRCGNGVRRLLLEQGQVVGAELTDGSSCLADVVVIATGSDPAVEWLRDGGLDLTDGLSCDALCQVGSKAFGAGDVASYPSARFGRRLRLEHRMNATEQGIAVARNILGAGEAYDPIPFFWTDQYDVRLQVHGIVEPGASQRALWGDPASDTFVIGYCGPEGVLRGVLAWNAPREARRWRARIGEPLELAQAATL